MRACAEYTIRGTNVVVDTGLVQLASSQFQFDSDAVFSSHEIEGALLLLMALAQSAGVEATSFATLLRTLIARLEACLGESSC